MISIVAKIANYCMRLARWLWEAWRFVIAVAVPVLVLLGLFLFSASSDWFRWSGGMLEFVGILLVVGDLRGTLRDHGTSLFSPPIEWLARFPGWRPTVITGVGLAAVAGVTVTATGSVVPGKATGTVEDRLNAVEQMIQELRGDLAKTRTDLDGKVRSVTGRLETEIQDRRKEVDDLRVRLTKVATGGRRVSFVSIMWVCLGLLLSTFSTELGR